MSLNLNAARGGKVAETESTKNQGGGFEKVHYFPTLADGGQVFVRFVTDMPDVITCKQHARVATKSRPANFTGENWPQYMSASCRKDDIFLGMFPKGQDGKTACYVCDDMVKPDGKKYTAPARTWGLACIREEILWTPELIKQHGVDPSLEGKRAGFKDKLREVPEIGPDGKPTGNNVQEKDVVVVNMGYGNFWSNLDGAFYAYGTILDRDFIVRRRGLKLDTDYQITPLDPSPGHDLRDKDTAAKYGEVVRSFDWDDSAPATQRWVVSTKVIEDIIADRASDEYIATFFDPTKEPPARGNSNNGGGSPAPAAPGAAAEAPKADNGVDMDKVAAMQQQVRGYGPNTGQQPAAPAATPVPAGSPGGMMNFG